MTFTHSASPVLPVVARMEVTELNPQLTSFYIQDIFLQECISVAMLTLIVYSARTPFFIACSLQVVHGLTIWIMNSHDIG